MTLRSTAQHGDPSARWGLFQMFGPDVIPVWCGSCGMAFEGPGARQRKREHLEKVHEAIIRVVAGPTGVPLVEWSL